MSLFGTFDTMQLTDVLQWIKESKATGRLIVNIETDETDLMFDKGDLARIASGESLRLDFGQYLFTNHQITEDVLKKIASKDSKCKEKEDYLCDRILLDYLSSENLLIQKHNYSFEIILNLLFFKEGSFHFTNNSLDDDILKNKSLKGLNLSPPVSTRSILMEAMKRLDDWQRIKEIFPSPYSVVSLIDGATGDNPVLKKLQEIKKPLSAGDLCLEMNKARFDVYNNLYTLFMDKKITIDEINPGKSNFKNMGPVEDLLENAKILLDEHQFEEAREVLSTIISVSPGNRTALNLMSTLRDLYIEYLYKQIPPYKTPVLNVNRHDIDGRAINNKELYLANRINGKWDVGMLVLATPLGELDTLRTLKKLIHAGIIKLIQ
ncbi:MAG: DUF4388 domain-containing protein [Deltaproteobacteria bacterium]|nr:DUF4388 domain-containing protein [Deltaproteobacteria bacterium]